MIFSPDDPAPLMYGHPEKARQAYLERQRKRESKPGYSPPPPAEDSASEPKAVQAARVPGRLASVARVMSEPPHPGRG